MSKAILDHRGTVLKTIFVDDNDHDRMVELTEQDIEPILEAVKRKRETHVQDSEMKLAAVIPAAVVEQMMRDGSWGDEAALKRWMNDPQNACFRVWSGKV
jgi:hypothetical protein